MALWVVGGIVVLILVAWAVLTILTRIEHKRFERQRERATEEERREMQLAACRIHAGGE